MSSNNSRFAEMASAIGQFAGSMHLAGYLSGRFGVGLRELPQITGYDRSTVLLWLPESNYARIIELTAHNGSIPRYHVSADHADWQKLRVLQLLGKDDSIIDTTNELQRESGESQSAEAAQPSTLETIPEGIEDQSVDDAGSNASTYLQHDDKQWQAHVDKINEDLTKIVEPENEENQEDDGQ